MFLQYLRKAFIGRLYYEALPAGSTPEDDEDDAGSPEEGEEGGDAAEDEGADVDDGLNADEAGAPRLAQAPPSAAAGGSPQPMHARTSAMHACHVSSFRAPGVAHTSLLVTLAVLNYTCRGC